MRRSEINALLRDAAACFARNGWALPPEPRWDVTDFGLGDCRRWGLVLVNLAAEPEYCEKLMYARRDMMTVCHFHRQKKEDIICRSGRFAIRLWPGPPARSEGDSFTVNVNGQPRVCVGGSAMTLTAGERITLTPGLYHEFWPETDECILGEVSTANDDANDNVFVNPRVGRFPTVIEDAPPLWRLLSDGVLEPAR